MALVPASDPVAGTSRWLPTHVQVTVLRARGLRGKSSGAGSTSDAYTVIQLGREKYSTSVVEKTPGCPEWREECSFELPPGALDGLLRAQESDAGPAPWAAPPGACELLLTTWHRSLIGVDKFLGRATVALDQVFGAGRAQHTEWYKLHSKAGKKEKERGEIQVTIQFTRNNLSASMFDLSVKDKPRSPFSKIKDKVRGKKKFDLESASAILPSSAVEDPELGSLGRMGKAKGFFLRDKLRKSSLTQSSTSLGSASTLSSASGSLAYQGPGAELLTRSPSRTSWLSTDGGRDSTVSPKLLTHKRTYSDEASQVRVAAPRALLDLQGHVDTASRSSLCINGGHIYNEQPPEPLRHRSSISGPFPPSSSLLSISSRPSEEGSRSVDDSWGRGGRRASSSEAGPGQEPSAQPRVLAVGASRSGEEEGALLSAGRPVQVTPPLGASSEATAEKEGAWKEERKPRMGLFHHHPGLSRSELGRRSSLGEKGGPTLGASPHHSSSGEEKAKSSWFGLREAKEAPQKPSVDVSPQVETGPAALPHQPPCPPCARVPAPPAPAAALMLSTNLPVAAATAAATIATPEATHEATPEATPPGLSGFTNPFLSSLQSSPFFDELVALRVLNCPPTPSLPSAARASPTPLASPGQSLTDWDDTFNIFAASRLCPEVRSQSLAPAAVGLEVTGLQAPNPAAVTVKLAESQGSLEGGGRDGSSMRLGPEQQRTRTADPEPLGSLGASLLSMSTQPHLRGSDSEPGGDSGPSPADSVTSLFSSPEVISVWERLPGTACAPEAQDGEVSRGDSQLFQELSTASDSWPWDVVTVSPTPDTSSPALRGESDELSPKLQTEAPEAVSPTGSARLPPQKRDPEPELQRVSEEEGLQPSTPPPKPPRLFTPGGSQVEEEDDEDITERLCAWGPEASDAAFAPSLGLGPGEPREEPGEPTSEESDGHSSETLLGELGQEDVIPEDASPLPASGSCLSQPTGCPEGPISTPARSESPVLDTGEATAAPEAQSQGLAEGELRPPSACSQQKGTLNPFLSHGGREPPSFPSTSPPGSRDSSIHPGPEELPTLPEPAFPQPHVPPRASHPDGGPSPQCPPLPGAQPLASSSPPSGALASPPRPSEPSATGGPPAPLAPPGEDLAAAIPASPLALLPLETRPAEEPLLRASPHLVKPLSAAPVEGSTDRKSARSSLSTALSSGLEKLKTVTSGSVQPVAPAPQSGQAVEAKRLKDSGAPDQSAKYYHLTHDELIGLLLQRERELSQRDEHVQALESYIDRLLVRIMETSPTLLQIPAAAPPE